MDESRLSQGIPSTLIYCHQLISNKRKLSLELMKAHEGQQESMGVQESFDPNEQEFELSSFDLSFQAKD